MSAEILQPWLPQLFLAFFATGERQPDLCVSNVDGIQERLAMKESGVVDVE